MPGVQRIDFRHEELPALFALHGAMAKVAQACGWNPKSLQSHIDKLRSVNPELARKIDEARARYKGARVPKKGASWDVTTQEGREGYGKDAELKYLRVEKKKLQEKLVDQETLVERLVSLSKEPRPAPNFAVSRSSGERLRDALLPIYDVQFGQRVKAEDTPGGMNTFSVEIFKQRLARYVDAVGNTLLDYSKSHAIENLIIPFGGDAVEGWGTFKAQEWHLELDPVEQVIQLVDLMVPALGALFGLAKEELGVRSIGVFCVSGNHGKPGGRSSGALPSTLNFDYLFYRMLQKAMGNYPVDVWGIEPAGSLYFVSQGYTFLMIHGHEIRSWGSIPMYGLTRWDARAIRLNHQIFSYAILGHHHVPANLSIGYGEHLMSGNWVGANSLSREIVAGGRPSQWVFFTSKQFGVGERSLIYLDENSEPKKPRIYECK